MADENQDQQKPEQPAPTAIPPKAVPPPAGGADAPTVRRQPVPGMPPPGVPPSAAPRTVRLKPVTVPSAAPTLPSAAPAAPGGAAAAEALKRMTSRIPMPAGSETSHVPMMGADVLKKSTTPLQSVGVTEGEGGTVNKVTSRIPMPSATGPVPSVADAPKTIKIKPLAGSSPIPGTQPVPIGELVSPQAVKSKTSRIPLEAAMGIPQAAELGAPKTIKLKRPGEMATVKVTMAGVQAGEAAPESGPITQRKTIRVKRPTAPAINVPAEGATSESGAPLAPVQMQPMLVVAPERGTGWFILVAALCIVVTLGLLVEFSAQIFGPNESLTQLSVSPTPDMPPLPGSMPVGGG